MTRRYQQVSDQLKTAVEAMDMKKQQQGSSLHLYTDVMKAVATPESMDSSYVMRMQAQLCKAMHSMGIAENQLALVTRQSEVWTKFLKDSATGMVEEKSQVELKLMNELVAADNGRREADEEMKTMMDKHRSERDVLEKKIEEKEGDDDEEEEEDDEEEREELMEILTQGREEIARMEAENQKQAEVLEGLKEKFVEKGLEVPEIKIEVKSEDEDDDEETDEDQ